MSTEIDNINLYFVPAFTGLGAPYWKSDAKGILCGIARTTGREEIVRAATESIAYQIADIVNAMEQDAHMPVRRLCTDGGAAKNSYLMQFQSDILKKEVLVSGMEEMSGIGTAYAAGIALGFYEKDIAERISRNHYIPGMEETLREKKLSGWKNAVGMLL